MTSHCGPCLANIKTQRPSGLNCGAWEGQVERRGSSCQRSCSFSSCGFPCAHIKGSFVAVWSLHSPLSKLLGSMFYPSSDSSYWYLKSALISFFSPSAHLGYLTGREFFSGMQGMKGEACVEGGAKMWGVTFLGLVIYQSFKVKCSVSSWNSEMCGQAKYLIVRWHLNNWYSQLETDLFLLGSVFLRFLQFNRFLMFSYYCVVGQCRLSTFVKKGVL